MDPDLGLFLVCLAMGAVEFRKRRLRLPTEHTVLYVGAVAFQDECREKGPKGVPLPDVWPRVLRGRQLCDDAVRSCA